MRGQECDRSAMGGFAAHGQDAISSEQLDTSACVRLERFLADAQDSNLSVSGDIPLSPRVYAGSGNSSAIGLWRRTLCDLYHGIAGDRVQAVNVADPSLAQTACLEIRLGNHHSVAPVCACLCPPRQRMKIETFA